MKDKKYLKTGKVTILMRGKETLINRAIRFMCEKIEKCEKELNEEIYKLNQKGYELKGEKTWARKDQRK